MCRILFFSLGLFCFSCLDKKSVPADSDIFLPSQRLAELTKNELEEVSGLAASITNPGLLWTHNDSGNPAIVYLIDEKLEIRLACKLVGVKNRDWEDITVGPGPEEGKQYIYVGDIGDNNAKHDLKYIYRFEEPSLDHVSGEVNITDFDTIVFKLGDAKKDTETIMIHPRTRNIYLVSKREEPVHVYELRYPFNIQDTLVASSITTIPLTRIVGGSFSPKGDEVLLKNYDNIYYWKLGDGPIAEGLKEKPQILRYTEEPQGEAITFNLDASGFYTLSEKIRGEKTYLYFYKRR